MLEICGGTWRPRKTASWVPKPKPGDARRPCGSVIEHKANSSQWLMAPSARISLLFVLLAVVVCALLSVLRLLLLGLTLLLVAYAAGYARYYDFGGDVAWGHRFVLLPVQLLCLFAAPLLLQHRWPALWALVFASVILQAASTVISPNVEVIQRDRGSRQGVLWNRAVNIGRNH